MANWDRGFSAAFNPLHILEAGISSRGKQQKHQWWWSIVNVGAQRQGRLCRSWSHDWLLEPTLTYAEEMLNSLYMGRLSLTLIR